MITVVLASECFAGCSKKTIENSAASNASVLEENEKETETFLAIFFSFADIRRIKSKK